MLAARRRLRVEGSIHDRLRLIAVDEPEGESDLATAVRAGLTAHPKSLPCRLFYDREGSRIFDEICDLPEYYLTRAEHEILTAHADDIAHGFRRRAALIELGSGSAIKTRILIEAFLRRHGALRYAPVDISRSVLEESARSLLADYPGLQIHAVAGEYRHGLRGIGTHESAPKLILWLGSSIGNFTHEEATRFLTGVAAEMSADDRMLVGADLRKDPATMLRAYDDAAGVTARFNKNLLARINRELDGSFDLRTFRHEARWNEIAGRIEMHLVSTRAQTVHVDALGIDVPFARGETIHTENSHKYTAAEMRSICRGAGLEPRREWLDAAGRFAGYLLERVPGSARGRRTR
jgi:dimethylhistidine N-methyltransferase